MNEKSLSLFLSPVPSLFTHRSTTPPPSLRQNALFPSARQVSTTAKTTEESLHVCNPHLKKSSSQILYTFLPLHYTPTLQKTRKIFLTLRDLFLHGWCSRTLNLTVLARGLHWPIVTTSPSPTFWKHGEQCTDMLLWRFSKRLYFDTYCR